MRLLRLVRRFESTGASTRVVCEFDLVQFCVQQSCPPYRALSYAWGPLGDPIYMPMVDGSALPITKNLCEALHHVIDAEKLTESTWLWIDQICIDQSAIQERNHQVQIMGNIYEKAEEVLIWLGGWNTHINRIAHLLKESESVRKFYEENCPGEEDEGTQCDLVDLYLNHSPRDALTAKALRTLFNRSWFTRAWVVQEAAMARGDTVFIGTKQTTLLQLYAICRDWLRHTESTDKFRLPNTTDLAETTWLRLSEILIRRRLWLAKYTSFYGRDRFNLLNTMNRIGGYFNVSEPKDLVYAFVGMCEIDAQKFPVDYDLTLAQGFEQAAKYLVNSSNSLRLLGHCWRASGLTQLSGIDHRALGMLPSWVPNWSGVRVIHPFDTDAIGNSLEYDAANGFRHKAASSKDEACQLRVKGSCIGCVRWVSHVGIDRFASPQPQANNSTKFSELSNILGPNLENLWLDSADRAIRRRLLEVLIEQSSRILGMSTYELKKTSAWSLLSKFEILPSHESEALCRHAIGIGSGRCVIRSTGDKLGLAPAMTKRSDLIAILHGSEVPIILRPVYGHHFNHFKVIGQCYLEGVMQGEAVTWKEHEADEFILV